MKGAATLRGDGELKVMYVSKRVEVWENMLVRSEPKSLKYVGVEGVRVRYVTQKS